MPLVGEAAFFVLFIHGLFGVLLHFRVETRDDRVAALEQLVGGEVVRIVLRKQQVAYPSGEPGVQIDAVLAVFGLDVEVEVFGFCRVVFVLRDDPVGEHARKHDVTSLHRRFGVDGRVVHRGGVGDADQRGGLCDGQVVGVDGVVVVGCSLDAVAAVAVVDGVEVHHQDLVFGEYLLEVDGKLHLAHLALQGDVGHLVGDQGVAHVLLRDR